MPFFLVDVELFPLAGEQLLEVELFLVVEDFVGFVAGLHVEQHFLLGAGDLEYTLLVFEFGLQLFRPGPGLVDPLLILGLENAEFANLFLNQTQSTFILSIFSYRPTRCLRI